MYYIACDVALSIDLFRAGHAPPLVLDWTITDSILDLLIKFKL